MYWKNASSFRRILVVFNVRLFFFIFLKFAFGYLLFLFVSRSFSGGLVGQKHNLRRMKWPNKIIFVDILYTGY